MGNAVEKVIAVLEDWFWAIENGEADSRMPDPNYKRYTDEQVDKLIKDIDDDIAAEVKNQVYWGLRDKYYPADFNRINGPAREAFAQDLCRAFDGSEYNSWFPPPYFY